MDQGNSSPNNQNPNNPIAASPIGNAPPPPSNPAGGLGDIAPDAPSSFGTDSSTTPITPPASNFDQPGTFSQPMSPSAMSPGAPPTFIADNSFGATPAPVEPPAPTVEANPFGTPAPQAGQDLATAPTPFNPFSSPATGSVPPPTLSPSSEAVPTDLSNLVDNTPEATNYMPQADTAAPIQPEPMIVAPSPSSGNEVNQAVSAAGGSGGFPKIIIVIGGIVLLAVIAASAYFILGIGKPAEPVPTPVMPQQPIPTPIVTASPTPTTPVSTQSGTFSNLPGATVSATPAAGGGGTAYERLLKSKQSSSSATNP